MTEDKLQLTKLSKTKVEQLNNQVLIAQEVFKSYVQGCLDTFLDSNDSGSKWIFNLDDMAFHKVKETDGTQKPHDAQAP